MSASSTPVVAQLFAAVVLLPTVYGGGLLAPLAAQVSDRFDPVVFLPAPYQIDGHEWRAGSEDSVAGSRLVTVGLGRAPDAGSPDAGMPVPAPTG